MKRGDYSIYVWVLLGAVAATITAAKGFGLVSNGSMLKSAYEERFNAWYGDANADTASDEEVIEEVIEEYTSNFDRLEDQLATIEAFVEERDTLPIHKWVVTKCPTPKAKRIQEQRLRIDDDRELVPIEVYDGDTTAHNFSRFIDKLIWGQEVRIAFMGDSFIEGDILTSDLREKLQATFGGRGVGFVQCDIPFETARRSVKRNVSGWTAYSVLKPKKNPADINDWFFVSGYTARGGVGAKANWQTATAFEHLDSCSRARILLTTPDSASVRVTINRDTTLKRQFDIVNIGLPQEIRFEGSVDRVELEVLAGTVDCYGASIEGCGGVIVDNLSMRANSGHAIFGTSAVVNKQIDTHVGYDLVVLQYGLNIMEAGKSNYSAYRTKLNEMIAYAKSCFPDAAILVLGVSDRWVKDAESGVYGPMSSVGSMISYQRSAAKMSAVSFWPTADAMALYGGMPGFVSNGWAAKDYTHINFAGGKRVGEELHRAIVKCAYDRLKSGKSTSPTATTITYTQPIKVETKPITKEVTLVAPENITTATNANEEAAASPTTDSAPVEKSVDVDSDAIVAEGEEKMSDVQGDIATEQVTEVTTEVIEERTEEVEPVITEEPPQEITTTQTESVTIDTDNLDEEEEFFETTI